MSDARHANDTPDDIQQAIRKLIAEDRFSRRGFLRRGVSAGAALSIPALLAACGIAPAGSPSATATQVAASASTTPEPTPKPSPAGTLNFANWPLYIDVDEETKKHPTLDEFTKKTGIKLKYQEAVQDNESFVGTIQPDLVAGNDTGWDLIVVTDWMVQKMIRLGWLEKIDVAGLVPNFGAHAADIYKGPYYDPNQEYSAAWQSGITGIGYNPKLTKREITSIEDLFDPKFAGRIGMFSEMHDSMGFALLSLGIKPADATEDDAKRAQEKLRAQKGVRKYYGNEYTDELAAGNLAITMAWSGDVYQLQLYDNPDLKFVVPKEGGMRWIDNMVIPKKASHPIDAQVMMDWVYGPDIATKISEYIGYFSPVKEVPDRVRTDAAKEKDTATKKQLEYIAKTVAPTAAQLANSVPYKVLSEDEEKTWNELFQEVVSG